jgi:NAD(P)-dependent dehydrogenase (short-subunit alcohol dehydrogenase family)
MPIDFNGKVAVVTGGANGIGLAAARALAAGGAQVWIFDLERERPEEVARPLGGRGCHVDVTAPSSIDAAFQQAGAPDIVVANAGGAIWGPVDEISADDWNKTIALNLSGVFHTVQAAARRMKPRRRGAIVITASTNSYDGEASLLSYNASKAGLLGILHTAANELGPWQIRINAVCPGLIHTRLTESFFRNAPLIKEYFRGIPLGRGGAPDEVGNAIAFLASDLASFITGATLFVDGGQMACKFGTWTEETADFVTDRWKLR